ncbi:hypothetical protein [Comamonas thiooxydans]|uniref:hypothetical protein n=1 Tax=Comamonas thiooxydans TaxID=363952 RepID=UPI0015546DE8|nr:hypothetical protein [Comamonas thiooxydans]
MKHLAISESQAEILKSALNSHIELLESPTSADRDARGDDAVDQEIKECKVLLNAIS